MKASIITKFGGSEVLQVRDVPFFLQDFVDHHEGRYRDVQLPLPMRLV